MIRAEHTLRHRSSSRQPRYIIHCMTPTRHYAWTRRPVTYEQALRFVERTQGKCGRVHWFEKA